MGLRDIRTLALRLDVNGKIYPSRHDTLYAPSSQHKGIVVITHIVKWVIASAFCEAISYRK
jgi:hypothetical protein